MSVVIRGVRRYGEGKRVDVLVDDGQIADIGARLQIPEDADVIDATGQILLPGFVDLHTTCVNRAANTPKTSKQARRRCFGRIHRGVRDGQHQPVADSPVVTDHVCSAASRWVWSTFTGRRGHNGTGRQRAHRDGHDGRGAAQVRMFSDDGNCVAD
ncbi:amidohydrolase family protein, partial [Mycobacterium xenopi 4042]